jgi:hypothetical protein
MNSMMSAPTNADPASPSERPTPRPANRPPLAGGASLLIVAGVCQFIIGPATSPGFSYLAVILALGGIGMLLAAGIAE